MRYMIFNSAGAAENAQQRILKLWSQYLSLLGYGRDGDFVVNTGIRNGRHVPAVTSRWSSIAECEEGFAVAHPDTHTFEDGTLFSVSLCENYDAEVLAQLGIPPTPNVFGAAYTESNTITVQEVAP